MKNLCVLFILIFLTVMFAVHGQTHSQMKMIDEKSIIKDMDGKIITLKQCNKLLEQNQYILDPKIDEKGYVVEFILRKASTEEIMQLKELKAMNSGSSAHTQKVSGKDRSGEMQQEDEVSQLIGTKAPAVIVVDMNGKVFSEDDLQGKVLVVNFWFTKCIPCKEEIPKLNLLMKKYSSRGDIVFIAPTFDDKKMTTQFLSKIPFDYHIVIDAQPIIERFNVKGYPSNIVIDKKGNFHFISVGAEAKIEEKLESAIQSALSPE